MRHCRGMGLKQASHTGLPMVGQLKRVSEKVSEYPLASVMLSVLGFAFLGPLAALVLVATMLDHEFGHKAMMRRLGYMPGPVRMVPLMGAFVRAGRPMLRSADIALIYVAGPLAGILSAEAAAVLASHTLDASIVHQVYIGAAVAIGLNLMNLLPYEPLDGGLISRVLPYQALMLFPVLFGVWLLYAHQLFTPVGAMLLYCATWATSRKLNKWRHYMRALRKRIGKGDDDAFVELRASIEVPRWERVLVVGTYGLLVVGGLTSLHSLARAAGWVG
jgi:membrane-associated protease RseP (regulator of RpoE activity)